VTNSDLVAFGVQSAIATVRTDVDVRPVINRLGKSITGFWGLYCMNMVVLDVWIGRPKLVRVGHLFEKADEI